MTRWWRRGGRNWIRNANNDEERIGCRSGAPASPREHFSRQRTGPRDLLARFRQVRDFSESLCATLEPEDYVVQSMPDVSPTKWHLAHTSWFFETFILKVWMPGYQPEVPEYAYLFNSYYNAAGDMHRRDLRGLISRPTVAETYRFRHSIDAHIEELLGKRRRRTARANRAGLHNRSASRAAAPGAARHRHQTCFCAEPASSGFPATRRTAGAARDRALRLRRFRGNDSRDRARRPRFQLR